MLLLHGDLSSRDENGDMFVRLADALSARGIASLRIDFAGSGDSEEPDLDLNYPNMVVDATAVAGLPCPGRCGRPDQDRHPRAVPRRLDRGHRDRARSRALRPSSRGAARCTTAYDEDPDGHQDARDNGYVPVDLGDRDLPAVG